MDIREFDRTHFKPLAPDKRSDVSLAFSVMADQTIRLNARLLQQLFGDADQRFLRVSYWEEEQQFLLEPCREEAEDTVKVPKSGAFKMASAYNVLTDGGIRLPARFDVRRIAGETAWIGENVPGYRFNSQKITSGRVKKPRKTDLDFMMPREK